MTEAKKDEISKLKGIRQPAVVMSDGNPHRLNRPQFDSPTKIWATHTEFVHGQEVQLMLWPHFWRNAESSEYMHVGKHTRHGELIVGARTLREHHIDKLENVGAMEWKEEFVDFTPIGDDKFYGYRW
ncbi:Dimeric alpha-beta barrel [Penicillium expansum]|nr:Dimeric alpha-beta barrel [Penicillium expansum]